MFLFSFHFSCIGTSHFSNRFLFHVNCAIMLSFCLPLILSFLQSSLSIISYFYHLFRFCLHCILSSPHLRSIPSYPITNRFDFWWSVVVPFLWYPIFYAIFTSSTFILFTLFTFLMCFFLFNHVVVPNLYVNGEFNNLLIRTISFVSVSFV